MREHTPGSGQPPLSTFTELPPPTRSLLPATLSVIAIAAIVGTVITMGVVNRNGGTPEAVPAVTATAVTTSTPASSAVVNTSARLTYQVPSDWVASDKPIDVLGVRFTGAAEYGGYDCAGARRVRARVVGAAAQSKASKPLDPESTAAAFAKAFGETTYPGAQVAAPTSESTLVDGKQAVVVTAKVSPKADAPCLPKEAEVTVLAIELGPGAALLVVTNDLAGGPDSPRALPSPISRTIIESARRN